MPLPADRCLRCDASGPAQRWRQRFPESDVLQLCPPCSSWLAGRADEYATDPAGNSRLVAVARTLAGEVWSAGERDYWFRVPPLRRTNLREWDSVEQGRKSALQAPVTVALRQVAQEWAAQRPKPAVLPKAPAPPRGAAPPKRAKRAAIRKPASKAARKAVRTRRQPARRRA